jgi:hypothetical protein
MTTAISICGRGSIINATSLVGGRWSRCCLGRSIDRSSPNCQAFSPLRSCTLRCPCAPTHRHGTLNDPAVVRIQRRSRSRRGTAWALCGSWGSGGSGNERRFIGDPTRALCPTAPAGPNTWRATARPIRAPGPRASLYTGSRGHPVGAAPGRACVRGCRGGRSASLLLSWCLVAGRNQVQLCKAAGI